MAKHLDTIFALSTGGLPTGLAVIRISGDGVKKAAASLCGELPEPRIAALLPVRDSNGTLLDRGLVIYFAGPGSFTGEDTLELQLHGSRAVVASVLGTLAMMPGFRQADAGEFSRRAFENGKLDLVEIEGLGELIHAETEAQRKLATAFVEGGASREYRSWMDQLSFARAMLEAELDFSDEGDIPGAVSDTIWPELETLLLKMKKALSGLRANEIVRDGFRVVITGAPNSGKSSLLNYLANRDVAIVTEIAGTTRDVISVDLDLNGQKISLVDTAGIRDTKDPVELAGIERAGRELERADLILALHSAADINDRSFETSRECIYIRSKMDLADLTTVKLRRNEIGISVKAETGFDSLLKRICEVAEKSVCSGDPSVVLNARHRTHVNAAMENIELALLSQQNGIEFAAEYLRHAADQLGRIVGFVNADELLGLVFSRFCVGK